MFFGIIITVIILIIIIIIRPLPNMSTRQQCVNWWWSVSPNPRPHPLSLFCSRHHHPHRPRFRPPPHLKHEPGGDRKKIYSFCSKWEQTFCTSWSRSIATLSISYLTIFFISLVPRYQRSGPQKRDRIGIQRKSYGHSESEEIHFSNVMVKPN